jgi:hypothetical protein
MRMISGHKLQVENIGRMKFPKNEEKSWHEDPHKFILKSFILEF